MRSAFTVYKTTAVNLTSTYSVIIAEFESENNLVRKIWVLARRQKLLCESEIPVTRSREQDIGTLIAICCNNVLEMTCI